MVYGAVVESMERSRYFVVVGHREEKRDPPDRLHQPVAQGRSSFARSDHPGESRAPAPDPDDYIFNRRRLNSNRGGHRRGRRATLSHRGDHYRRTNFVSTTDPACNSGNLLAARGAGRSKPLRQGARRTVGGEIRYLEDVYVILFS